MFRSCHSSNPFWSNLMSDRRYSRTRLAAVHGAASWILKTSRAGQVRLDDTRHLTRARHTPGYMYEKSIAATRPNHRVELLNCFLLVDTGYVQFSY